MPCTQASSLLGIFDSMRLQLQTLVPATSDLAA
jgi:hypothetical protein